MGRNISFFDPVPNCVFCNAEIASCFIETNPAVLKVFAHKDHLMISYINYYTTLAECFQRISWYFV